MKMEKIKILHIDVTSKSLQEMIELYNMKEELSNKVIDYIEYLKFSYMTKAPDNLIIKDDKDLLEK